MKWPAVNCTSKSLKKSYALGVAVFDNARVRHAYSPGVLKLVFE